jgi:hypothetical protein
VIQKGQAMVGQIRFGLHIRFHPQKEDWRLQGPYIRRRVSEKVFKEISASS